MTDEPLEGVRACVFDAYRTLFDYASAAARCRDALGDKLERLTTLWRDKQLQYTWLRAIQGYHVDFQQVTGDALDCALGALGLTDSKLRRRLISLYFELEAFPEVPETLGRLRQAGMRGGTKK
jgi:2-haloacid dehalogenase